MHKTVLRLGMSEASSIDKAVEPSPKEEEEVGACSLEQGGVEEQSDKAETASVAPTARSQAEEEEEDKEDKEDKDNKEEEAPKEGEREDKEATEAKPETGQGKDVVSPLDNSSEEEQREKLKLVIDDEDEEEEKAAPEARQEPSEGGEHGAGLAWSESDVPGGGCKQKNGQKTGEAEKDDTAKACTDDHQANADSVVVPSEPLKDTESTKADADAASAAGSEPVQKESVPGDSGVPLAGENGEQQTQAEETPAKAPTPSETPAKAPTPPEASVEPLQSTKGQTSAELASLINGKRAHPSSSESSLAGEENRPTKKKSILGLKAIEEQQEKVGGCGDEKPKPGLGPSVEGAPCVCVCVVAGKESRAVCQVGPGW